MSPRTTRRRRPAHPRLISLVGELSAQEKDFGQWWGGHLVASRAMGTKGFRHHVASELALDRDTLTCCADPHQELVVRAAHPRLVGLPSAPRVRSPSRHLTA
ncbi:hypothetical protein OG426_51485 [Streptomyces canus]|uniref:MmyB family transcriptional regulator n=1 Tax=Streptomyces canus TaxID=58343 RepID=UPI00224E8146|nr:hypothetical protein [Streptomyces canus]MCX4854304.1 hypothetical protein [Streptomyces canus]WSW40248.1 hypothetical protein OG426_51485 [Streptomyces canus]